jgi:hypothetical protein
LFLSLLFFSSVSFFFLCFGHGLMPASKRLHGRASKLLQTNHQSTRYKSNVCGLKQITRAHVSQVTWCHSLSPREQSTSVRYSCNVYHHASKAPAHTRKSQSALTRERNVFSGTTRCQMWWTSCRWMSKALRNKRFTGLGFRFQGLGLGV